MEGHGGSEGRARGWGGGGLLRDFLIRKVNEWSGSSSDARTCTCISLLALLTDIVGISAPYIQHKVLISDVGACLARADSVSQ